MAKAKGMFQKLVDITNKRDTEAFKNLFHEDYMHVRETDLVNKDEFFEEILVVWSKPDWNWHQIAKYIYEYKHTMLTRWEENGEVVTNSAILKEGQFWRTIINRAPKETSHS